MQPVIQGFQIIGRGQSDALRDAIIDVALMHKIVSRYTSFVAVDKTPVRPVDAKLASKNVPNARPAGQADQPFAYPQTATPAVEKLWLGTLSLALAMQLWWLRRRDLLTAAARLDNEHA
jgi:Ca-activated chloride channel family protein